MDLRRAFPGPVTVVDGPSSLALIGFIKAHLADWREYSAPFSKLEGVGIGLAATVVALEETAKRYRHLVETSGEFPAAEAPPPSGSMTASAAADRLGITERRVRQLCASGELAGRLIDGRWRIDPESVEARA